MGAAIAIILGLSSLGWGLIAIRLTRTDAALTSGERLAWGAVLGMGVLGWLGFVSALALGVDTLSVAAPIILGLGGLVMLRREDTPRLDWRNPWIILLSAVAVAVIAADVAAALVPAADADSMAYHFALIKGYAARGEIEFFPMAVDGAVPLLVHMTYLQAYALGGEPALTLWCGLNSWFLPLAALATASRTMPPVWALALALAIKTLPAVVYGAPAGQVEVRLAAFFLVAAFAAARARSAARAYSTNAIGLAVLAGLAAGFAMGTKYSGLVAPAICGVALLGGRNWFGRALAFGTAALVAGGQWYAWNAIHTGDPLFPMLWGKIPYVTGVWDTVIDEAFRRYMLVESGLPKTAFWLLAYPFKATFDGLPIFESGRTGFGPLPILLLPFALAGLWLRKIRASDRELHWVMTICLGGYAIWFLGGASQRVRHFLPYLVPALIALSAGAVWASRRLPALKRPLATALILSLGIQMAGLALFSYKHVRWLGSDASRDDFLAENIALYPVARWLNETLKPGDRLLLTAREIVYLIDAPVLYAKSDYQTAITMNRETWDVSEVMADLKRHSITHILVDRVEGPFPDQIANEAGMLGKTLLDAGCGTVEGPLVTGRGLDSRTLRLAAPGQYLHYIVAVADMGCLKQDPVEK